MQLENASPVRKPSLTMINYRDNADDYDHNVHDHDQFEVDHDVYDHNNYALDDDVNDGNQFKVYHDVKDDVDQHELIMMLMMATSSLQRKVNVAGFASLHHRLWQSSPSQLGRSKLMTMMIS